MVGMEWKSYGCVAIQTVLNNILKILGRRDFLEISYTAVKAIDMDVRTINRSFKLIISKLPSTVPILMQI